MSNKVTRGGRKGGCGKKGGKLRGGGFGDWFSSMKNKATGMFGSTGAMPQQAAAPPQAAQQPYPGVGGRRRKGKKSCKGGQRRTSGRTTSNRKTKRSKRSSSRYTGGSSVQPYTPSSSYGSAR